MTMGDMTILDDMPEFFRLGGELLKASPSEEDGERLLYIEASNEDQDREGEVILQKALADSAEFYLRHGNIDLSHYTAIGAKLGIPNHMSYEIGRPIAARVDGKRTFVKAQLYRGESDMAKNANMVWDSLTKQFPPARWYPSVGGKVLSASVKIDPLTKAKVGVVDKVLWNNTALDRCPVNSTVAEVSTVPIGTFSKAMGGFTIAKSLTAGYGTDMAELQGGEALRVQSLDKSRVHSYFDFRNRASEHLRDAVKAGKNPGSRELIDFAAGLGLSPDEGAEFTERFLRDLKTGAARRRRTH